MPDRNAPRNRWTPRGHGFALLGLAAMHRGFRARLLDEARQYHNMPRIASQCLAQAKEHSNDARRFIRNAHGFGRNVVLP